VAKLDAPEPMAGQVRIHVRAAAVNPVDIATRAGRLADAGLAPTTGQIGIGWDLAGVIDALGPGVDRFRAGDPVIAMRDLLSAPVGAQAEHVVLDTDAVAPAPRSVSPVEAATLPLNGLTAAQALDLLALREGQWLLVTGAAGAVGGFALELASLRGLRTVAVAAGAAPTPLRGTRIHNVWIRTDAPRLAELAALVDAGRLTPRVADVQPLDTVAAAHERLGAGGIRGRIVLEPRGYRR
jgi:NADPH:quinone reductase-like Zn-dependent oxidoreductase